MTKTKHTKYDDVLTRMTMCTSQIINVTRDEVDASFSVGSAASTSGRPRALSTDASTGRSLREPPGSHL